MLNTVITNVLHNQQLKHELPRLGWLELGLEQTCIYSVLGQDAKILSCSFKNGVHHEVTLTWHALYNERPETAAAWIAKGK